MQSASSGRASDRERETRTGCFFGAYIMWHRCRSCEELFFFCFCRHQDMQSALGTRCFNRSSKCSCRCMDPIEAERAKKFDKRWVSRISPPLLILHRQRTLPAIRTKKCTHNLLTDVRAVVHDQSMGPCLLGPPLTSSRLQQWALWEQWLPCLIPSQRIPSGTLGVPPGTDSVHQHSVLSALLHDSHRRLHRSPRIPQRQPQHCTVPSPHKPS